MERLEELRADAVEYLTRNFSYRIPEEVAHGMPARDLFSGRRRAGKRQTYACIVLKVMHVMHHLAGRELLFKLPVSDDEVFGLVEAKVVKRRGDPRRRLPDRRVRLEPQGARQRRHQAAGQEGDHRRRRLRQAALPLDHASIDDLPIACCTSSCTS